MPFVGGVFTPYFRTPPGPTPPARRGLVRPPVNLVAGEEEEVTRVTPAGQALDPTSNGTVQVAFNNTGWIAVAPSGRVVLVFAFTSPTGSRLAIWTRSPSGDWSELSQLLELRELVIDTGVVAPTVRLRPGTDETFGICWAQRDGKRTEWLAWMELRWRGRLPDVVESWGSPSLGSEVATPCLAYGPDGSPWLSASARDRTGQQRIVLAFRGPFGWSTTTVPVHAGGEPEIPSLAVGDGVGVLAWRTTDSVGPPAERTTWVRAVDLRRAGRGYGVGFSAAPVALAGRQRQAGTTAWDPCVVNTEANRFQVAWQGSTILGVPPIVQNAASADGYVWSTAVDVCDRTIRPQNQFPQLAAGSGVTVGVWEGGYGRGATGIQLASAAAATLPRGSGALLGLGDQHRSPEGDNGLADHLSLPPVLRDPDVTWPTVAVADVRAHLAWFARNTSGDVALRYRSARW